MTKPASLSAFKSTSGVVPSWPLAIPTAISRCSNGRPAAKSRASALIVHHTDADREWAYDRESHIGKLDKGLDEAPKRGWTVVNMKNDWKRVFPFEK